MGDAATPVIPNAGAQTGTVYKANIDAGFAVLDRLAWAFAAHEQAAPDMTVRLDAGALFDGTTLTEVAAQSTGAIAAPSVDPRIDRVVIDAASGAVSVETGTEAASPSPPAIPSGKLPVAQVALIVAQTEIVNADLTDERVAATAGTAGLVQMVNTQTGAVATGTTTMPSDDTIPQNTEGDEYMTLAITPKSTSNKLVITVIASFENSSTNPKIQMALFQDATAGALAAAQEAHASGNTRPINIVLTHTMTAGTTSLTTFKIRAGGAASGTTTFNGIGGARSLGGVMASSITIEEVAA